MKRVILASALILACALAAAAQRPSSSAEASNEAAASATTRDQTINIASGTRLAAELQNTLDARKAKVGDQVVLKTTESIKSEGRTVVKKGALLRGHVTAVEQKTKGRAESQVGLVFDELNNGSLTVPITATISSITQARGQSQSNDGSYEGQATTMSRADTGAQRAPAGQSGGLLGGAANTVGGVVNGATSTVGSTANSTTSAVGQTTSGVGQSLGRIQISESTSASAEGSSVLTLQGDNLHLEKGTTFTLLITQSASAGADKKP